MKIKVRVFGELSPILGRRQVVNIEEGTTVGALTQRMAEEAGLKRRGYLGDFKVGGSELAVLVNGRNITRTQGLERILRQNDEVAIIPPTGGGGP